MVGRDDPYPHRLIPVAVVWALSVARHSCPTCRSSFDPVFFRSSIGWNEEGFRRGVPAKSATPPHPVSEGDSQSTTPDADAGDPLQGHAGIHRRRDLAVRADRFASCDVAFVPIGMQVRMFRNKSLLMSHIFSTGEEALRGLTRSWSG